MTERERIADFIVSLEQGHGDLCDEILWLHEGQVRMYGKAKEVLTAYEEFMK